MYLGQRPHVINADGSASSVRTISANFEGRETLIPTVSHLGRIMSDDDAIAQYKKTREHLGQYRTVEDANIAADQLHLDEAARLKRR